MIFFFYTVFIVYSVVSLDLGKPNSAVKLGGLLKTIRVKGHKRMVSLLKALKKKECKQELCG